jgi:hypothetical protein
VTKNMVVIGCVPGGTLGDICLVVVFFMVWKLFCLSLTFINAFGGGV